MSWKEEVALTLQSLIESVQDEKTGLGENVDKLEEGENSRRQERSLLLSKTFKKIFAALNEKDKKMVATIKTNAYDVTRQLDKVYTILHYRRGLFLYFWRNALYIVELLRWNGKSRNSLWMSRSPMMGEKLQWRPSMSNSSQRWQMLMSTLSTQCAMSL